MQRPWIPPPTSCYLLLLFLLSLFLSFLPPSFSEEEDYYQQCRTRSLTCGDHNFPLLYPFDLNSGPSHCGYPDIEVGCNDTYSAMTIAMGNKRYQVKGEIDYLNNLLTLVDQDFVGQSCPRPSEDTTLNPTFFQYSDDIMNATFLMGCSSPVPTLPNITCLGDLSYYCPDLTIIPPDPLRKCRQVQILMSDTAVQGMADGGMDSYKEALQEGFTVSWATEIWENCSVCMKSGGVCGYNSTQVCFCPDGSTKDGSCSGSSSRKWIIIGVCVGVAGLALVSFLGVLFYRRRKRELFSSTLLPRTASSEPTSKKYPELVSEQAHTQIFQYEELHEATDGFSASNELGDGGFGTVYKGNLVDGRTVAIKRLYENNYKRVEQFMTEVRILSSLRHQHLVSLHGCTSRHSRELLLVYEYVPNGTVADHLHGPRAHEEGLSWPVRMGIAIETADALSYLHAVTPHQIIHRDVKTNNILLDNSFHVKVADFGLSRLFPVNATHVSTAPQGTPGYVDPEYYQCYQLTDKSDVYSFGVVLVELISSKLAVDISRNRHEINLANMAITKIQNEELDQLVDPRLWCQSNSETIWMIRRVAEVAFRCLQAEKEMRPTMREVLEALRGIENEGCNRAKGGKADAVVKDDDCSLGKEPPHSPVTVTAQWESRSTTPNASV